MALNVGKELADLREMTVLELREKYEAVFGACTPPAVNVFPFDIRVAYCGPPRGSNAARPAESAIDGRLQQPLTTCMPSRRIKRPAAHRCRFHCP
jgi:hypothetical protein